MTCEIKSHRTSDILLQLRMNELFNDLHELLKTNQENIVFIASRYGACIPKKFKKNQESGPILESKGMRAIFQKNGKKGQNIWKLTKFKIFWKNIR